MRTTFKWIAIPKLVSVRPKNSSFSPTRLLRDCNNSLPSWTPIFTTTTHGRIITKLAQNWRISRIEFLLRFTSAPCLSRVWRENWIFSKQNLDYPILESFSYLNGIELLIETISSTKIFFHEKLIVKMLKHLFSGLVCD